MTRPGSAAVVGILAIAAAMVAPVHAHEIGTTRVSVAFNDRHAYDIEIATDAAALVEKLAAISGQSAPSGRTADALSSVLRDRDALFRQRVQVLFDGTPVQPDISYRVLPPVDAASAPAAIIRMTGAIPDGASAFAWRFGWTFASYALTIRGDGGDDATTQWLEGGDASAPVALRSPRLPDGRLTTARKYLVLGFTHIVPYGFDHVLFVLGIYLLSRRARAVLAQVTAFTVAHSITLGLSLYGIITVAPAIVEPLIAISIAYVAVENILVGELRPWRVALVFAFGLLHGLGFAGALRELGLPRSQFVTALLTFNAGVELGQMAVIGAAFLCVGCHFADRRWYRQRVVIPASAVIAGIAVYWTMERLAL